MADDTIRPAEGTVAPEITYTDATGGSRQAWVTDRDYDPEVAGDYTVVDTLSGAILVLTRAEGGTWTEGGS